MTDSRKRQFYWNLAFALVFFGGYAGLLFWMLALAWVPIQRATPSPRAAWISALAGMTELGAETSLNMLVLIGNH